MLPRLSGTFVALLVSVAAGGAPARQPPVADGLTKLIITLEALVERADREGWMALAAADANPVPLREFAERNFDPATTRAVVRERDRVLHPGPGPLQATLMVDAFIERGPRGRVGTWRLDVRREGQAEDDEWRIMSVELLSAIDALYRLTLDPTTQYEARGLLIAAEDLQLSLPSGSVFVARADGEVTALVLRGRGELVFSPAPATEKGQLRLFAGADVLRTTFDSVFLRIQPGEYHGRINASQLVKRGVDARELARADEIFSEFVSASYGIDLRDLSRERWSLLPGFGDLVAEIRTRRYGTLTYARSTAEAEDITLFDRKRKRNIALYASVERLASRGRFYTEDDRAEYDVLDYDLDLSYAPERQWLEGRARLRLRVKSWALAVLTLRLAAELNVESVHSDAFGRLLSLRVVDQDSLIVNLPSAVPKDTSLVLTVVYSGRIEPQTLDREAIWQDQTSDVPVVLPEARFLYSNRSYWYPQAQVSDYATAVTRLTVPPGYTCVATGDPAPGSPVTIDDGRRTFAFVASQPARYLSFVVSRFTPVTTGVVEAAEPVTGDGGASQVASGPRQGGVRMAIAANPRQVGRGREMASKVTAIMQFYRSLAGDFPYRSFTLALVESQTPGGHSPAYFVVLNQPLPTSPFVWRNDPVAFEGYPDFFLAHEIAHQWWGQAVGWKNYHEQWLSEGFAQYFAALYAERDRGRDRFDSILRRMRRTAMDASDQGPVYLGYRLGHITGQGRVFRSLVYNKGAAVLHMLRRLVGDEVFFRAVRRFYAESRFAKAGTDDLRRVFAAEAGRSLERFFERWIHGASLPRLVFSYHVEPASGSTASVATLRFEQIGEVFDVPVSVTLTYTSGHSDVVTVPVVEQIVEHRVTLAGPLRQVAANEDQAALAHISTR
jgi:hypothetical protein